MMAQAALVLSLKLPQTVSDKPFSRYLYCMAIFVVREVAK